MFHVEQKVNVKLESDAFTEQGIYILAEGSIEKVEEETCDVTLTGRSVVHSIETNDAIFVGEMAKTTLTVKRSSESIIPR